MTKLNLCFTPSSKLRNVKPMAQSPKTRAKFLGSAEWCVLTKARNFAQVFRDSTYGLTFRNFELGRNQGRSQDFSKGGGGGHTVSNIIVMAFSPRNIVGCLLKKRLTKGGHGYPRTPLATPLVVTSFCLSEGKSIELRFGRED